MMPCNLSDIFPDTVKALAARPDDVQGELYPEEKKIIQHAVSKRQREFRATRLMARELLKHLKVDRFPLLSGVHREPLWPAHICGSITHTDDFCAVAIALTKDVTSVGLDAQKISVINDELQPYICHPLEKEWINALPEAEQNCYSNLVFSAKECFFKWQFPLTQSWLNFNDCWLTVDKSKKQFQVNLLRNPKSILSTQSLTGKYQFTQDLILTGICH